MIYLLFTYHLPIIYRSFTYHLPIVYLSFTYHLPIIYLSFTYRLPIVYLSFTYHLPVILPETPVMDFDCDIQSTSNQHPEEGEASGDELDPWRLLPEEYVLFYRDLCICIYIMYNYIICIYRYYVYR